tara:strand:- start:4922 stop:6634 length:1713 start_codon:yes stop_codon:yes gene_type:complete
MITFKTIRWRNFLSTGNRWIEIELTKYPTNLIVGANGAGKSTILDALCFVLFNKPFRKISKGQLANTMNEKECEVQVDFTIGTKDYQVVRGIKPGIFEIYIDGKVQDQFSSAVDQQKHLEDNILKLNFKSFTQTVILGSATFVPFMQLKSSHRREIVEDLLDIKIFSSMSIILRDKMRMVNESIKDLTIRKQMVEEKISMQKSFISDLDKKSKDTIKNREKKLNDLEKNIKELLEENSSYQSQSSTHQEELKKLSSSKSSLKKLNTIKAKLDQRIQTITSEHKFFNDNTVCPTCEQDIQEDFRLNRVGEIEEKVKEINSAYKDLQKSITKEKEKDQRFIDVSQKVTALTNDISTNNFKISEYQRQTREFEQEVQDITDQIENRNTERATLRSLQKELKDTESNKSTQTEDQSYLEFASSLMRDGGVKSKIIKRYLPIMNKQINHYLQLMDFYINFTLDDEFNEIIKSPIHEKFSYESFSEGEKMRIDLALLFTWRDIAKMKNSSATNLLILDEIFDSSLDNGGTDEFVKIIRYVIKDAHIFLITHKSEDLNDRFDQLITFEKLNGFSRMV